VQFALVGGENEFIVSVVNAAGLGMFQNLDPLSPEDGHNGLADQGFLQEKQPVPGQERHFASQPGEGLREFDRYYG
jgi:hypothetical protein